MLSKLELKSTRDTPEITFDPASSQFEIKGNSLPEDTSKFFDPILDWIEEYVKSPNKNTVLKCQLEYFNSSSAKMLYQIFIELEKIKESKHDVKVIWYYEPGDSLIEEKGLEYQSILDLPFEMLEIN